MERLDEIKKRLEKANKGPWFTDGHYVWEGSPPPKEDLKGMISDFPNERMVTRARGTGRGLSWEQQKANMEFLAACRQDVPWLIEQIENFLRKTE